VALNVATRSWGGLLRPLDYDQSAPPLFLWLEKLAIGVAGPNELALRAPALLAGILSVPLLFWLARRVLDERGAAIAAAVGAFSPLLIQHSNEAKPYALDLLTALVLLLLGLRWSDRPASPKRAWIMGMAGVVSIALSIPAVFVLTGIGLALWSSPESARPPRGRLAAVVCAWVAIFAVIYVGIYRPAALNPYMQQYWESSMLTFGHPQWPGHAWQLVRDVVWQTLAGGPTAPSPAERLPVQLGAAFALVCCAAGFVVLAKRGERRLVLTLLSPVALAVIGAMLGLYPIAARLMLFVVPSLIIPLVVALSNVPGRLPGSGTRAFGGLLGVVVLLPPLGHVIPAASQPTFYEHVRPVIEDFNRHAPAGEPIYVYAATLPMWAFYTTDWSAPDTSRLARIARLASSGGPSFENGPSRPSASAAANDSLMLPFRGSYELFGTYSGVQWRSGLGLMQYGVDPEQWAVAEASRLRAVARPTIWIIVSRTYGLHLLLYRELERLGGQADYVHRGNGVGLRRYRFPL
jgi:hypothetical protein